MKASGQAFQYEISTNNSYYNNEGKSEQGPEPDQIFFVVVITFHLLEKFVPKITNYKES